jgi:hypothetical protein
MSKDEEEDWDDDPLNDEIEINGEDPPTVDVSDKKPRSFDDRWEDMIEKALNLMGMQPNHLNHWFECPFCPRENGGRWCRTEDWDAHMRKAHWGKTTYHYDGIERGSLKEAETDQYLGRPRYASPRGAIMDPGLIVPNEPMCMACYQNPANVPIRVPSPMGSEDVDLCSDCAKGVQEQIALALQTEEE